MACSWASDLFWGIFPSNLWSTLGQCCDTPEVVHNTAWSTRHWPHPQHASWQNCIRLNSVWPSNTIWLLGLWVNIGSGIGLLPWHQSWSNGDLLTIGPLRTNFREIWIKIPMQLFWPFWSGLNILIVNLIPAKINTKNGPNWIYFFFFFYISGHMRTV